MVWRACNNEGKMNITHGKIGGIITCSMLYGNRNVGSMFGLERYIPDQLIDTYQFEYLSI